MALFSNDSAVDAAKVNEDEFALLPDGPYEFVIYEAEADEFSSEKNGGKPRLIATLKIMEGPYKNRQLKDFMIPLFTEEGNDWANRYAKNFFLTGLGFESFDDIPDDVEDLLGKKIKAVVKHEADNRDPDGPDRNRIGRYLPTTAEVTNGDGVLKEPAKKKKKPAAPGKL